MDIDYMDIDSLKWIGFDGPSPRRSSMKLGIPTHGLATLALTSQGRRIPSCRHQAWCKSSEIHEKFYEFPNEFPIKGWKSPLKMDELSH